MTFAHLTLATRDVPATIAFFEQTLGWNEIPRPGNIDRKGAWLDMGAGQQVHLLEVEEFRPSDFEDEFGRHVAIFFSGAEFGPLKQRLAEANAQIIDPQRSTPFERFFFRDPNGYVFEVIDEQGYAAANPS